ncbi:voltage-gated hydrogen channel 1-like [Conger conger]|uniref:voltage-gated hydrogen channel 1-like n=1 Tax=Conger conger TaxID=82655 RepID=UPI002A5A5883|nr:voltage-gated hydrogen channel 1-like [Conger conger]
MSQYLKHFTAVGDEQHSTTQWPDEEQPEPNEDTLVVSAPQHKERHHFQDSLRRWFSHGKFQIFVVCLVILDVLFVLCELLMDLSIIKSDEGHIAPQVFHYLSLSLLTFFIVELAAKVFAYQQEFFRHKFEVLDGVVVILSFVLDIVYISHEDAFDAVGLLILLRLWRVARIINGLLVSVKNHADHKIQKLKETNKRLIIQINEQEEHHSRIEQENIRLQTLLQQHDIDF